METNLLENEKICNFESEKKMGSVVTDEDYAAANRELRDKHTAYFAEKDEIGIIACNQFDEFPEEKKIEMFVANLEFWQKERELTEANGDMSGKAFARLVLISDAQVQIKKDMKWRFTQDVQEQILVRSGIKK